MLKKLLNVLLISLIVIGLTGCSSSGEKEVLTVYNAGEYIDEDLISKFKKEYNCEVRYSTFASNEEMHTNVALGTVYDVIIPSDYMIETLISEGLLQKIDKSLVPNMDGLYSGMIHEFDPNYDYSVPYFWGNVGIVYDSTIVDQKDVETEGWAVFQNTKYAGQIYIYNSSRDAFMVALKQLGYSMNTTNVDEIAEATEWLLQIDRTMSPAYADDECIDGLATGEKAMGYMYSGDAAYILSENENMKFYAPECGTNVWTDAMVIHKDSEHVELAHKFINFMLDPENAEANSSYVGYASPVESVLNDLAAGEYEGNEAYLPRTGNALDETFKALDDTTRELLSVNLVSVVSNEGK